MQVDPGNAADKVEIVNMTVLADGVGDVVEFDPQAAAATANASTTRNLSNLTDFPFAPGVQDATRRHATPAPSVGTKLFRHGQLASPDVYSSRRILMPSIAYAATIAVLLSLGQSTSPQFVGTWTSEYFGRTLARLDLQNVNGSVTGRMSIGYFHVDSAGKLDVVIEEAAIFTPIFDVVLRDGVLSFAKMNDGTTDRYQLRVSGDTAKLSFLLTDKAIEAAKAAGMGAPQPIVFKKAHF